MHAALAMAMAGTAGAPLRPARHTGAGIARREAYHARRAEDRAVLEETDAEAVQRARRAPRKQL